MADQPQTPRVGVVGAQANQPGAPAQQAAAPAQAAAPRPGLPGVQQPPVPSPEQIAKIVAEQQRVVQQQVQQSQKQAGYTGENAPPAAAAAAPTNNRFSQQPAQQPAAQQPAPAPAPAQSNQAVSQIPANIAAQMPPQMTQQQSDQPAPQSPIPGLSAEQVLAGPPQPQSAPQPVYQQPQPPPQPVYQGQSPPPQQFAPQQAYQQPAPQQQFAPQAPQARPSGIAAYAQPQAVDKPTVPWYPVRGKGKSVDIELSDVILKNVPSDFPTGESNAAAKVVLALFSEILALKDQVQFLMENQQNPQSQLPPDLLGRVYNLERTLFEQKQSLSSRARGVKDQIAMGQAQGHTPEQILATLQGQSAGAAQMVQSGVQPAAAHTTTEQQPTAQASQAAAAGQATEPPASE